MSASYVFGGTWRVPAPVPAVQAVLADLEHYPDWWPQVLAVAKVSDDDARVLCRSTLPYTLDLVLHAERRDSDQLRTGVSGDLTGFVAWHLSEDPVGTLLELEQQVQVTGRVMGLASYVAKPVLRWNHERMMAGCLTGLHARLGLQPV